MKAACLFFVRLQGIASGRSFLFLNIRDVVSHPDRAILISALYYFLELKMIQNHSEEHPLTKINEVLIY